MLLGRNGRLNPEAMSFGLGIGDFQLPLHKEPEANLLATKRRLRICKNGLADFSSPMTAGWDTIDEGLTNPSVDYPSFADIYTGALQSNSV